MNHARPVNFKVNQDTLGRIEAGLINTRAWLVGFMISRSATERYRVYFAARFSDAFAWFTR